MKSKSETQKSSWGNSLTHGIARLNKPPKITKTFHAFSSHAQLSIGDRPFITYAVLDSFELDCIGSKCSAILCREADIDVLAIPGVEPVVCFIPVPGKGVYAHDNVRPSILFWKGDFWIPLWMIEPEREEIAIHVYGEDILRSHTFDVLYQIKVDQIPDIDLLKINHPEIDL